MGSGTQSTVFGGRLVSELKTGVYVGLTRFELCSVVGSDVSPAASPQVDTRAKAAKMVTRNCLIASSLLAGHGYPVVIHMFMSGPGVQTDSRAISVGANCRDRNIALHTGAQSKV